MPMQGYGKSESSVKLFALSMFPSTAWLEEGTDGSTKRLGTHLGAGYVAHIEA